MSTDGVIKYNMRIRNGLVFRDEGHFENDDLYIENGRFAIAGEGEVLDAGGLYVIPGLMDIHFHGCVGYDFSDGGPDGLSAMAEYQLKNGVTSICPATMSLPFKELEKALSCAALHSPKEGARLVGVNLEGPFLSEEKVGAQKKEHLEHPSVEMFFRLQQCAGGAIKLVSIAPELPGAIEFIKAVKGAVLVSLGHTTVDYNGALKAFEAGAGHVTHLYNAMEALGHRQPGLVGAAYDTKGVTVELIADGKHVHPAVVRATFQIFGGDRIVLISDSMRACGLLDGSYTLGGQTVTVAGGRATLSDGTLAGSVCNLMDMVRNVVKMGIPLGLAVKCASVNPAKALGVYPLRGSLCCGSVADAVLLDEDLNIRYIIQEGRVILCR